MLGERQLAVLLPILGDLDLVSGRVVPELGPRERDHHVVTATRPKILFELTGKRQGFLDRLPRVPWMSDDKVDVQLRRDTIPEEPRSEPRLRLREALLRELEDLVVAAVDSNYNLGATGAMHLLEQPAVQAVDPCLAVPRDA